MHTINRREFIRLVGGAGALLTVPGAYAGKPRGNKARVVIIGGGFGGATCAKYLHRFDPTLNITLIEASTQFSTCPFSNAVLGGLRDIKSIRHGYGPHKKRGIHIVHDWVSGIDPAGQKITLKSGKRLSYDKLVVSPGIDFRWDAVNGMDAAAADRLPHAWQAGAQTILLQKQLVSMKNGGTVIIAPPDNPFRCPPGPYERASLIAHYLKQHKPKSKVLIVDAKDKFSKQGLFVQGWKELYGDMIEWIAGSRGGRIEQIDVATQTLLNEVGDKFKGEVVNFIPPQKAGAIAHTAGLVDKSGWCPVNQRTFASSLHPNIHVIGDAAIAGKMPKSGFAANSQGKVCAAAIVSDLHGLKMPEPSYVNTCYSLLAPDYGISVAAVYRFADGKGIYSVEGAGGVSPADADRAYRREEARFAGGWYDSITADAFG